MAQLALSFNKLSLSFEVYLIYLIVIKKSLSGIFLLLTDELSKVFQEFFKLVDSFLIQL